MKRRKMPKVCSPTELEIIEMEMAQLELRKRKIRIELSELRGRERDFEEFLHVFREVSCVAWDTVLDPSKENIIRLKKELERSDSHWPGHGGCARDIVAARQIVQ